MKSMISIGTLVRAYRSLGSMVDVAEAVGLTTQAVQQRLRSHRYSAKKLREQANRQLEKRMEKIFLANKQDIHTPEQLVELCLKKLKRRKIPVHFAKKVIKRHRPKSVFPPRGVSIHLLEKAVGTEGTRVAAKRCGMTEASLYVRLFRGGTSVKEAKRKYA